MQYSLSYFEATLSGSSFSLKQRRVKSMSNETSPTNEQVATLKAQVFALVKACPAGRVTTYGLIATSSGCEYRVSIIEK